MWIEREKHTSTDYAVNGWMLCVTTHIREDILNSSNGNNRNQVNTFINNMFADSSEKDLHETLDTCWIGYTNFKNKNDPFDRN